MTTEPTKPGTAALGPKPTRAEIEAAREKGVPDVIAPGLQVLFVGINPGLYSAAIGHHFGRPGNRFWPVLHRAGFTERQLSPYEDETLLERGYGITNVVARATATADELRPEEYVEGGKELEEKVRRYRPRVVAFVGIGAYRTAFGRPRAKVGRQEEKLAGAEVWVLPNPSGLNANYSVEEMGRVFGEMREELMLLSLRARVPRGNVK